MKNLTPICNKLAKIWDELGKEIVETMNQALPNLSGTGFDQYIKRFGGEWSYHIINDSGLFIFNKKSEKDGFYLTQEFSGFTVETSDEKKHHIAKSIPINELMFFGVPTTEHEVPSDPMAYDGDNY
jgi:hypothetical protein